MSFQPMYIDLHVLQTLPPSNVNRDDTGSPKTARFGGVTRARVSSQSWKKAIRDEFARVLDEEKIGQRTLHVVEYIAQQIQRFDSSIDDETAIKLAQEALTATGIKVTKESLTGYLMFISPGQASALAKLGIDAKNSGSKIDKKSAKAILNIKERPTLNAVDIAAFGRMVADAPDLNVDAAVQVSHALGVAPSETEFDYFTGMDDRSPADSVGAGMIGTNEFLSATLYRYATIDVYHLCENLGSVDAACGAIEAFVRSFVVSMPTGKQNSYANRTLPSLVLARVLNTQPVSLVTAYETPVFAQDDKGVTQVACDRLFKQAQKIEEAFDMSPLDVVAVVGDSSISIEPDANVTLANLGEMIDRISKQAEDYLYSCSFSNVVEA